MSKHTLLERKQPSSSHTAEKRNGSEFKESWGSKLMFVLRNQKKRSAGNTIGGCLDLSDTANRQKTNDLNQLEGPQLTSIIPFVPCLCMGMLLCWDFGHFKAALSASEALQPLCLFNQLEGDADKRLNPI